MPEGPDGKTIIIVKKVSGHGGHHGGAWKVAYADFVTSMMALFMVLWLVNSASEPTRQRIASYFRKPGIFQKGSGTPLEVGGGGILRDTFAPPADANSQIITDKKIYEVEARSGKVKEYFDSPGKGQGDKGKKGEGGYLEQDKPESGKAEKAGEADGAGQTDKAGDGGEREDTGEAGDAGEAGDTGEGGEVGEIDIEQLRSDLEDAIDEALGGEGEGGAAARGEKKAGLLGQIDIKVDQRGLVVEIMDTENASMFHVGSAGVQDEAEEALSNIALVLKELPNPIDIEGHTDARPYRVKGHDKYDNWNLSSDRAHAARRVLEKAGIPTARIARVVGYADQRLKVKDDPLNPSNRRITIAMRFTEQAKVALKGTQTTETRPKPMNQRDRRRRSAKKAVRPDKADKSKEAKKDEAADKSKKAKQDTEKKEATKEAKRPEKGLRVEIGTRMPEGAIIKQADEPPPRPTRIEKDKIFGDSHPFFRK